MKKPPKTNQTKQVVNKILITCKDYSLIKFALAEKFTLLTNPSSPRFEEFNKTYKVAELAECKTIKLKSVKTSQVFGAKGAFKIKAEVYFYSKAPNGLVVVLSLFDLKWNKKAPLAIDFFADESVD